MADEQNPFTQVYNALWTMLEAHTGFTDLVRIGNRIKFTGTRTDPNKPEIMTADLPEVRLIPIGTSPHIQRTSNSGSVVKRFEIQLATGQIRLDQEGSEGIGASLFPIEWEILRAMHGWQGVLGTLTWNGKTFVRLVRPGQVNELSVQPEMSRSIRGWVALWACEVEMWFTTADLAPVATP